MTSPIASRAEIIPFVESLRKEGKKIGYTSGVFDLLHPGHVEYLKKARALCDFLVVGVNSDTSVKSYKSPDRPIMGALDRAQVVGALECVDAVFIFSETNNNRNIELLRPDLYIKAGDYSKEELSSAPLVEAYGGRVELVPMREGYSTTGTIERIRGGADPHREVSLPVPPRGAAVFVDRDGTINEHIEYLHEADKFRLLPGAMEGLRKMQELGFRIVVVTNQPGIGLGYFPKEALFEVNRALLTAATKAGVNIDRIYFCPHSKADGCRCRKPGTELVERAARELNIDLVASFVIGDMSSDIQLGKNVGCQTILVGTGRAGKDGLFEVTPDFTAPNLLAAAQIVELNREEVLEEEDASDESAPLSSEALEAIGKVCGKLGHDFNNLLGSMMGCVDLIESKMKKLHPGENPIERQIRIMKSAISRGTDITSKIRGYSRPGPVAKDRVLLSHCVASTLLLLQKGHPEITSSIAVDVRKDSLLEINEFLIGQVVMSLLSNALDALKSFTERTVVIYLDEAEISEGAVEALAPGRYALLSVIDHGLGISSDQQAGLFTPLASKKSGIGEGIGLGLVMAQEIMRKHKGAIVVQSLPNVGTSACLYFPIRG